MSGDRSGQESRNWKGGRYINDQGYVMIHPGRPLRSAPKRYLREHIVIAEKILGKPLPLGAEIHHVDENRSNNTPSNLVICQSKAYHKLLHYRMRALKACGHAHWVKCEYCGIYDDPRNMYIRKGRAGGYHNYCVNEDQSNKRNIK